MLTLGDQDIVALEAVRELERVRIEAIRANDADKMDQLLDDKFLCISSEGVLYDKTNYVNIVRSHGLTYAPDLLPALGEAIEAGDSAGVSAAVSKISAALDRASKALAN